MKNILIVLTILSSLLLAQKLPFSIDTSVSFVKYTGSHSFHKWSGQSNRINGTIYIDEARPTESEVIISIPIFTFDSQNGNRDSNMLFVIDEDIHPNVIFSSNTISQIDQSTYNVVGILNFHGIEKDLSIPVKININSNSIEFKSKFNVNLIDFNIDRPKLLLRPINEIIGVELFIKGTL